jgi:hypothetical protein
MMHINRLQMFLVGYQRLFFYCMATGLQTFLAEVVL